MFSVFDVSTVGFVGAVTAVFGDAGVGEVDDGGESCKAEDYTGCDAAAVDMV